MNWKDIVYIIVSKYRINVVFMCCWYIEEQIAFKININCENYVFFLEIMLFLII